MSNSYRTKTDVQSEDKSLKEFQAHMLQGDRQNGFDGDQFYFDVPYRKFVLYEFCKTDPYGVNGWINRPEDGMSPWKAHVNWMWRSPGYNSGLKFFQQFKMMKEMGGWYYIVHYAWPDKPWYDKRDPRFFEVKFFDVVDADMNGIKEQVCVKTSWKLFSKWFRQMNTEAKLTWEEIKNGEGKEPLAGRRQPPKSVGAEGDRIGPPEHFIPGIKDHIPGMDLILGERRKQRSRQPGTCLYCSTGSGGITIPDRRRNKQNA